jgi:hypothetical protein
MRRYISTALVLACISSLPLGCDSNGVGDPCVPEEEYEPGFSGFSVEEVNAESRSFQCATRLCLVNHFQGRVSCPYGQTEQEAGADPKCFIPDAATPVRAPVGPQLHSRRAADAVYCSCRCDGPDPTARYCECPSGYACTELVPEFQLGQRELTGKYCVREGTQYDKSRLEPSAVCDRGSGDCD